MNGVWKSKSPRCYFHRRWSCIFTDILQHVISSSNMPPSTHMHNHDEGDRHGDGGGGLLCLGACRHWLPIVAGACREQEYPSWTNTYTTLNLYLAETPSSELKIDQKPACAHLWVAVMVIVAVPRQCEVHRICMWRQDLNQWSWNTCIVSSTVTDMSDPLDISSDQDVPTVYLWHDTRSDVSQT